jgi:hypothetical protein
MWPVAAGKRDEAAPRSNAGLSQDVVYMWTSLPFVLASREICIVIWNKGHDLNYMFDSSIGLYLHVSWLEAFGLQMLWKAWMNDTTHTSHFFTCELWSQQNKTSSELDVLEQKTSVNSRSPTLNSMDCPQICHGPVNFWHLPKPNSNRVILDYPFLSYCLCIFSPNVFVFTCVLSPMSRDNYFWSHVLISHQICSQIILADAPKFSGWLVNSRSHLAEFVCGWN